MLFKIYFYNLLLFQIVSNCDIVTYALNKQKTKNTNFMLTLKRCLKMRGFTCN